MSQHETVLLLVTAQIIERGSANAALLALAN